MNVKLSLAAALSVLTLSSVAMAADLPRRATAAAPYVAPVPVFTWTGFYAGVNAGYGWGTQKGAADATYGSLDGAQVGGTAGYNYQMGQIVLGMEGDMDWSNAKNTNGAYISKQTSIGTVRGRVGYSVDRVLLFTTGGYAGGAVERSNGVASASDWHHGYALGGGMEYAVTNNVSAKAEYLYTDLASKTDTGLSRAGMTQNTVRMGVNYRF